MEYIDDTVAHVEDHEFVDRTARAFRQGIKDAHNRMASKLDGAKKLGQPVPNISRPANFLVPPWGWLTYTVYPSTEYEFHSVGVIRPRSKRTLPFMVEAFKDTGLPAMATGGGALGLMGLAGGIVSQSVIVAACAGVGGLSAGGGLGWRYQKFLDRKRQDGRLLVDGSAPPQKLSAVVTVAARIAQISGAIKKYETEMRQASREDRLDPIPLVLKPTATEIYEELHRALWDIASDESESHLPDLIDGIDRLTMGVDRAIGAAWSIRRNSVVDITVAPTPPPPRPRRNTLAALEKLTAELQQTTDTQFSAAEDIGRLNLPSEDNPGTT